MAFVNYSLHRLTFYQELHAHLTGSIRRQALHKIWFNRRVHDAMYTLEDPLIAMPEGAAVDMESFFPLFNSYVYKLCNTVDTVKFCTNSVLEEFANDGVIYFELRTTPRDDKKTGMTKEDYVEAILDSIREFEGGKIGQKTGMKTKLILSIDRRDTDATATHVLDLAILYKSRGVVGLDLAGDPLVGDINSFRPIFAKAKEMGFGITLHFAEAELTSSDEELNILLAFHPDRLSHVVYTSDVIKRLIQRLKYTLEMVISGNIQTRVDPRIRVHRDHHFKYWYPEKTNPIAICTDDVGIFNSKLSNEYYLLFKHFGLLKPELFELASGICDSIFSTKSQKENLKQQFEAFREKEEIEPGKVL
ncbi:hypothetical protein FN846DRAFT_782115 [Sphaerosporella brunnea]|uniref:Adenosine deaminase domain-containing protein n=1 Tax=Sphaerosporella brunnea TaxID=1250544 RepID=A0A5J5ERP6_9PEZI|nr:hypothetical protein FN846DRAFT_782115 [Sphaerosporella brunnea]